MYQKGSFVVQGRRPRFWSLDYHDAVLDEDAQFVTGAIG
jgi:hypothetical protein